MVVEDAVLRQDEPALLPQVQAVAALFEEPTAERHRRARLPSDRRRPQRLTDATNATDFDAASEAAAAEAAAPPSPRRRGQHLSTTGRSEDSMTNVEAGCSGAKTIAARISFQGGVANGRVIRLAPPQTGTTVSGWARR